MKSAALKKIVLIGASTGGPGQIQKIIKSLPILQDASVVIAQHMVEGFLESFASRLQESTKNRVSVIQNNQNLESSMIYVAEGISSLKMQTRVFETLKSPHNMYNPDINSLFNSFAGLAKETDMLCVILTGIGDDGIEACINLRNSGANCITESQESAIVDGMPNRAREFVPDIGVYEMDEIVKKISEFCDV